MEPSTHQVRLDTPCEVVFTFLMSTNDSFHGAVPSTTIDRLPAGGLVRFTYDELGARRPNRYHTITAVVSHVSTAQDGVRTIFLTQVQRIRPDGERTNRDALALYDRNVIGVEILEGFAA
jgi:hypothetical protein